MQAQGAGRCVAACASFARTLLLGAHTHDSHTRASPSPSTGALLSAASFQQPPDASLYIYTALRAASLFSAAHHRAPDVPDADALTELAEGLVGAWSEGEDLAGVGIEDGAWREALGKVCGEVCVLLSLSLVPSLSFFLSRLASLPCLARVLTHPPRRHHSARAPPGTTLPQTSALVGGLVAQEAIKLITRQYGPLEGTCVWDGIRSGAGVLSP